MAHQAYKIEEPSQLVQFWNNVLKVKFTRYQNILMTGMSFHGDKALSSLQLDHVKNILDVGCGWGDTAIELAEKIGSQGNVVGMDCVDDFLVYGRQQAQLNNITNVDFIEADVESYPFHGEYDLCFSRFGTMFFANPVWGLRNINQALKPGGEVRFVVWRSLVDNPWLNLAKQTVLNYLPVPGADAQTCGPGPFSMANQEMVTEQLVAAGFTDIHFERTDGKVMVGKTLEEAVEFQIALGPVGEIYREAGDLAIQKNEEVREAIGHTLRPYLTAEGVLMDSSSWIISAKKTAKNN